jgi:hypothetical protein
MTIEVPYIKDKELQTRFENWLIYRGNEFVKPRSIHAESFVIVVKDAQDAYWIGSNHVALMNKLFDGPLTRTLSG